MKLLLLAAALVMPIVTGAQKLLVALDGRQYNVESFRFSADGSVINFHTSLIRMRSMPVDSIAEGVSIDEEKVYHVKRFDTHSPAPASQVDFLEVVATGRLTIYKRALQMAGAFGGGWPAINAGYTYTYEIEQYFLEKEGVLKQVLPADGLSWAEKSLLVNEFVSEDRESLKEIENQNFKLTPISLVDVVEGFNARVFEQHSVVNNGSESNLFLFKDRNAPPQLTVEVNGLTWKLEDEVLIIKIPIATVSKVCAVSATSDDCKVVQGTGHFPLYFKVCSRKSDGKVELVKSNAKRFSRLARTVSYLPVP